MSSRSADSSFPRLYQRGLNSYTWRRIFSTEYLLSPLSCPLLFIQHSISESLCQPKLILHLSWLASSRLLGVQLGLHIQPIPNGSIHLPRSTYVHQPIAAKYVIRWWAGEAFFLFPSLSLPPRLFSYLPVAPSNSCLSIQYLPTWAKVGEFVFNGNQPNKLQEEEISIDSTSLLEDRLVCASLTSIPIIHQFMLVLVSSGDRLICWIKIHSAIYILRILETHGVYINPRYFFLVSLGFRYLTGSPHMTWLDSWPDR